MKKSKLVKINLLLATLMLSSIAFGQKGVDNGSKYGKGEDSVKCVRNLSLYTQYYKQKNYEMALPFWRIAFNECPASSKNLYIYGKNIYLNLQKKELDVAKKDAYVDSIIMVYDQRVKYDFGSESYVNQYKGLDVLSLRNDNIDALKDVYGWFKISITELKGKTMKPVLEVFVKVGISLYNQGEIDLDLLLDDYLFTLNVLEGSKNENLIDEINEQMISGGVLSCEQLIEIYTPKFDAAPEDLKLLVNITDFLDKLNCKDSELYYKALSNRHKLDATPESANMLAQLAINKELYDDAIKYLNEAIGIETDNLKKSDLYLLLAQATNKKGDKSGARSYAYKAIELNASTGAPYMFIGSLYAESGSECSGLNLPKAIYWVAIDKFVKAKSVDPSLASKADKSIEAYSVYYPNKEEAFFHGVKEGDKYKVECWINETTTARFTN